MKNLILLFILVSISYTSSYTTPADSCLKMIWPDQEQDSTYKAYVNPDSVRVDSCVGSETYGKIFAKQYYAIGMPEGFYPFDPVIKYGEEKRVSDINDNYPVFKAQFQQLENELGTIYFTRMHPDLPDVPDSMYLKGKQNSIIYFQHYQDIEYIKEYIKASVDSVIETYYYGRYAILVSTKEKNSFNPIIHLYPNPASTELNIQLPKGAALQGKISIIDLQGREVMSRELLFTGSDINLDITKLAVGTYTLLIKSGTEVMTGKFEVVR